MTARADHWSVWRTPSLTYPNFLMRVWHASWRLYRIHSVISRSVHLSSPYVIPHTPTPYVRTEAASGCPPDSRRSPPAGGMRPSWPGFLASPGRRPFLPGPLAFPYPTSRRPAMVRTGRKSFVPTNEHPLLISGAVACAIYTFYNEI